MSAVDSVGLGGGWANTVNVSTWQPSVQLAMACLVAGAWAGDLARNAGACRSIDGLRRAIRPSLDCSYKLIANAAQGPAHRAGPYANAVPHGEGRCLRTRATVMAITAPRRVAQSRVVIPALMKSG